MSPLAKLLRGRTLRGALGELWPLLSARLFLRRCQHVGRLTRLYGRARVTNLGTITIGERCTLFSNTVRSEYVTHPGGAIEIGDRVFINYGASISAHARVQIGSGSQLGSYAILMDNDYHQVEDRERPSASEPIVLGRNVWLGVRVVVLKGVSIGDNAVIGAGSVVTKSIPANCLAAGVPAKVLRRFEPRDAAADGARQGLAA